MCAEHGQILPFVKWLHFFLGPWVLVCQFIEISNQMEAYVVSRKQIADMRTLLFATYSYQLDYKKTKIKNKCQNAINKFIKFVSLLVTII